MGAYTRPRGEVADSLKEVYSWFPRLEERKRQPAGTLSGGEQQMLAMGRAMMAKPRILLMDEPSMAFPRCLWARFSRSSKRFPPRAPRCCWWSRTPKKALSIADRAYVLETGRIGKFGKASDLLNDDAIKKAYLGE